MLSNIRIVLVQTFHPGNIGQAARAMKTMGLGDLVLVNPRRFPDAEATRLAAGATDVLDNARVVEHISQAVGDCVQVIGASARLRSLPLPHFDDPEPMAVQMVEYAHEAPVALVFGRERFGLTNDEIRHCTHQVSIPANPDYSVLNLAQAVQILAYEVRRAWRHQTPSATQPKSKQPALPTREQMAHFETHLHQALSSSGFLTQPHARTEDHLHALFSRAQPTRKELSILRGVLTTLENAGTKRDD
ncbi:MULTISPECIES: TrmJ/YjtD family RNA methyltransferase [unclassified Chromohalobacter]|uniref:RNA methyltransferase n=1 Tax=unclassified Chromohalobacter TaxID=2628571 RepID=UPI0024691F0E|nr:MULTISPECIES: TrmJ/YjtD family RNA methyltransferase [unclassified Chromohalobacter]